MTRLLHAQRYKANHSKFTHLFKKNDRSPPSRRSRASVLAENAQAFGRFVRKILISKFFRPIEQKANTSGAGRGHAAFKDGL